VPLGVKFYFGKFYIHPEIGLGYNIFNNTKTTTNFSDGTSKSETITSRIPTGEFNKITIPSFISIGREFALAKKIFSVGIKGYYGLNSVVSDVPRNARYYGLGFLFGMKF